MQKITNKNVKIYDNVLIYENVFLVGDCEIESGTTIYPNTTIINSKIGKNCVIKNSYIESSIIKDNVSIGPFAHIRENSYIDNNCQIGNFVEVKNSIISVNTKAKHHSYIGDAIIGQNCNIGCGVIFVNYDGQNKNKINIGDGCFIGSNVNLIAPLTLANNTYICAGTTVTINTQEDDFVIGRSRETIKKNKAHNYYRKRNE